MEILESAMYIAIGFVPTLLAMEASWKSGRKKSSSGSDLKQIERSKKVAAEEVTPKKIGIR